MLIWETVWIFTCDSQKLETFSFSKKINKKHNYLNFENSIYFNKERFLDQIQDFPTPKQKIKFNYFLINILSFQLNRLQIHLCLHNMTNVRFVSIYLIILLFSFKEQKLWFVGMWILSASDWPLELCTCS